MADSRQTPAASTVSYTINKPSKAPFLQAVRVVILNAVVINQATVMRVLSRMRDTGVKVGIHVLVNFSFSYLLCISVPSVQYLPRSLLT